MDSKRKTQIEVPFFGNSSGTTLENPRVPNGRSLTNRTGPKGRNLFKPPNVLEVDIQVNREEMNIPAQILSNSSQTPTALDSGSLVDVNWGSPWSKYEASHKLSDLGGDLWMAMSFVNIRRFPRDAAEQTLKKFRRIKHQNVVAFYEAYMTDDYLHVVLESMTFTLLHIIKNPHYPNEAQLGTILSQVVDGLCFLEEEGWHHPLLDCENILVSERGLVKIANQQLCQSSEGLDNRRHLEALDHVTQLIMQKFYKQRPGIDDMDRWPPDSDGFTFLASIESASSVKELQKVRDYSIPSISNDNFKWGSQHPLMRYRDVSCLRGLIKLTQVTVFPREYSLQ